MGALVLRKVKVPRGAAKSWNYKEGFISGLVSAGSDPSRKRFF